MISARLFLETPTSEKRKAIDNKLSTNVTIVHSNQSGLFGKGKVQKDKLDVSNAFQNIRNFMNF